MQTFVQTFAANTTWVLNVPGKYFTTLQCTNPINVRFYLGGKQLDLGQISQLLAGLEVTLGDIADTQAAFDRVELDITGPDTVSVGIGNGQARYNRSQGNVAVTNTVGVSLQAADMNTLNRPELPASSWVNNATVAANTPLTIFTPAANVNGALIYSMESTDGLILTTGTDMLVQTFIAKSSPPTNVADGQVVAQSRTETRDGGTGMNYANIVREQPTRIAAGLGLYFISSRAGNAQNLRNCRYTLL